MGMSFSYYGPPKGKQGGTVPAYLTKQIASYQAALSRLGGGS